MRILARIFGGMALLLGALLALGLLLPGDWSTEANVTIPASPDSVYDVVSRIDSWPEWMSWPESGVRFQGPRSGPGAAFQWSDPVYGNGTFRMVEALPSEAVGYRVTIEEGAMVISGRIELTGIPGGTGVRWTEEGSVGWNPLLALTLVTLREQQEEQLVQTLDRLRFHLGGSPPVDVPRELSVERCRRSTAGRPAQGEWARFTSSSFDRVCFMTASISCMASAGFMSES